VGNILEMCEDRGTIESIYKCLLYYLRRESHSMSAINLRVLILTGSIVHWRIRKRDLSWRLGHWDFIPRTLHEAKGEERVY
jgi:hypothetical protein